MERTHDRTPEVSAQMGAAPSELHHLNGHGCQIDIGNYHLQINGQKCGELFVEEDRFGQKGDTIEHWMLYSNFRSPSREDRDVSIQVVYEPQGRPLPDFVERNLRQKDVRYIVSHCRLQNAADLTRST